ncbi:MAG: biosynthetic-type acetolactate synthase large subunit [Sporomusaceae bacterium]|nr:biosynthetic-type acetolactate synthase large subunit [Sporomusaceae bacterium]
MKMLGSEAIIESLKREGVEIIFGYPGGSVLTLYDALYKTNFPHILTRHEQGAVHAADGYARATGKTGVCFATSGPGATNLITGIATAYMDSIPLVVITGQVSVPLIGKDSFQEADISGITAPITKHNYLVKKSEDLTRVLKEAFYIARTGRPGPVVIDISKDVFNTPLEYKYPEKVSLRGYTPVYEGDEATLDEMVAVMKKAKNPLLFVGGGVILSDTAPQFKKFAKMTGFPVISSLMGLGAIESEDDNFLGMVGMHGTYAANMATVECDLLIGVGVRFDDRVTGLVQHFAPNAYIVHMDIDRAEVNKNVIADLKVIGDLRWSLPLLCEKTSEELKGWRIEISDWLQEVKAWRQQMPLPPTYSQELKPADVLPETIITAVNKLTKGEAVIVTDVGQHQMWAAQYVNVKKPRSFLTSGGLGTMGYGLPAAIGAKLGLPDKEVVLFSGDGSIMMNCQEMSTAADNNLPIKMIVFNNSVLGMVHQWQGMFYGKRYSHSSVKGKTDLVKLAEAMGVTAFRVTEREELNSVLQKMMAVAGPALVEIIVPETADVLPMVPAGAKLDQMILGGR